LAPPRGPQRRRRLGYWCCANRPAARPGRERRGRFVTARGDSALAGIRQASGNVFLLRPLRLISILVLVGLVGGGYWAWQRIHRSDAASQSDALAVIRSDPNQAAGLPLTGVYRYQQAGHERIGFGPLTIVRNLPAIMLVSIAPTAADTRDYTYAYSSDHVEAWRVQTTPSGLLGIRRALKIGTLGYTATVAGDAQPAVILQPRRLGVGSRWQWITTVSGTVFTSASTVRRRGHLVLAGRRYTVFVIQVSETATGPLHGNEQVTHWYAPALGVDLRIDWQRTFSGTIVNNVTDSMLLVAAAPLR
jgi:hypothetical protein